MPRASPIQSRRDGLDVLSRRRGAAFRAARLARAQRPRRVRLGDAVEFPTLAEEFAFLRAWQARLARDRWVGVHWPHAYGGRGAGVEANYIFQEEMARARAPEVINRIGVNLVGPSLMKHGTEEQKQRYSRASCSCDDVWCQLFSEPGAGSDLAALRTVAVRDGDVYRVTGQKVWTSWAQFADHGIVLARTDPTSRKARGISYMIVDMHAPGVEVRPLRQMTGSSEFNEVFLDDVRVPLANLVGEKGRAGRSRRRRSHTSAARRRASS